MPFMDRNLEHILQGNEYDQNDSMPSQRQRLKRKTKGQAHGICQDQAGGICKGKSDGVGLCEGQAGGICHGRRLRIRIMLQLTEAIMALNTEVPGSR